MDAIYKVVGTIIKIKLEIIIDPMIGKYQTGIRKGRKTANQFIIILTCEYEIPAVHSFYFNIYDSFNSTRISEIIGEFKIPQS